MFSVTKTARLDAKTIADGLGARRVGTGWRCACPAHNGTGTDTFSITDGQSGPLVYCHAGCSQAEVLAALRRLGLWPDATPEQKAWHARRQAAEQEIGAGLRKAIASAAVARGEVLPDADRYLPHRQTAPEAAGDAEVLTGVFRYVDHRTTKLSRLVLEFEHVDSGATCVMWFNVDVTGYRIGARGQFNARGARSKLRRFWHATIGLPPYRWCRCHKGLYKLRALDLVGTAVDRGEYFEVVELELANGSSVIPLPSVK